MEKIKPVHERMREEVNKAGPDAFTKTYKIQHYTLRSIQEICKYLLDKMGEDCTFMYGTEIDRYLESIIDALENIKNDNGVVEVDKGGCLDFYDGDEGDR